MTVGASRAPAERVRVRSMSRPRSSRPGSACRRAPSGRGPQRAARTRVVDLHITSVARRPR